MISRIKKQLKSEKNKKLISNFSYLTIINIANKALPLIVIPYIVMTIGIEKFGTITFAFAFASYFMLIPQYSFNLTATKFTSLYRDDAEKISQNFWVVMTTKFLLLLAISIFFLILLFTFDKFYLEKEVFLYTFIYVLANTLMPLWFFMGIEEMKYIAIFNIMAKITYTILVFVFVQAESDYVLIPLFNSLTYLTVSLYALYFIKKKFQLSFYQPKWEDITYQINEGKDIFYSTINVSFYTTINIVLLGIFSTYSVVGVYSLAQAIYNAYSSIIKSYSTVVYPHLAKYINDMPRLYNQARKFFLIFISLLVLASSFLFLLSDPIISLLYGEEHTESIIILKILSIAVLLEPLGGFFTAYLSLKSNYKTIRNITFKVMVLNLILVVPMILIFEARSIAYSLVILSIVQVYLNISHNREILKF